VARDGETVEAERLGGDRRTSFLFDLDGTLVDSVHQQCWLRARRFRRREFDLSV
jgi:hypothetical protein